MQTVTFYSYKGGTGRTLLLANVAMLSARMGWKVVVVDVDLEAPGLTYKLLPNDPHPRNAGLVGWLHDRFATGKPAPSICDSIIDIPVEHPFEEGGWLKLMPAGRNPSPSYFQDLVNLRLEQRITDGEGVDAFIDLQDQIRDDLAPDVLMLDARTGISATNLVTTRALADDVVALTLDSPEQLEGTRAVLRSLTPLTSLRTGEPLCLHLVVARVAERAADVSPYALADDEVKQAERVQQFMSAPAEPLRATIDLDRVDLLHTEPALASGEFLTLARARILDATALHVDYIRIAERVLGDAIRSRAAEVIAATADPSERETLAQFFAQADRASLARRRLPVGDDWLMLHYPVVGERIRLLEGLIERAPSLRPYLDRALLDLASELMSKGQAADAADAVEQTLDLPSAAGASPAFRGALASSLEQLARDMLEAEEHRGARVAARRAVALRRLAEAESPVHRAPLHSALAILAAALEAAGDHDGAQAALQESKDVHTTLAGAQVQRLERLSERSPSLRPNLARAHLERAADLISTGRREDAARSLERASQIFDELAQGQAISNDARASALGDLAESWSRLSEHGHAVDAAGRAVALRRSTFDVEPKTGAAGLASSLRVLAAVLRSAGDPEGAAAAAAESTRIYRRLLA